MSFILDAFLNQLSNKLIKNIIVTYVFLQFFHAITHLKILNDEINSDSGQIFNENPCSYTGDLSEASQVLDKCENFESKDASHTPV